MFKLASESALRGKLDFTETLSRALLIIYAHVSTDRWSHSKMHRYEASETYLHNLVHVHMHLLQVFGSSADRFEAAIMRSTCVPNSELVFFWRNVLILTLMYLSRFFQWSIQSMNVSLAFVQKKKTKKLYMLRGNRVRVWTFGKFNTFFFHSPCFFLSPVCPHNVHHIFPSQPYFHHVVEQARSLHLNNCCDTNQTFKMYQKICCCQFQIPERFFI